MAIQLKKGFVLRKIGVQYMAVPYGSMTNEVKGMVSLTESGYLLWQAIEKGTDTVEALADVLMAEYDVERDVAVRDVNDFVDYLAKLGAVTV
jgi:uncharacterized protein (DUF1697 family)